MNENKNTLPTSERQVTILGPDMLPLAEELRQGVGFTDTLVAETRNSILRRGPQQELTEAEAIQNYFDFLSRVRATAVTDETPRGREMLDLSEKFANGATYLSVEKRHQALAGLVDRHVSFLRENPNARISFYVFHNDREKSQGLLATEALRVMEERAAEVKERVVISPALVQDEAGQIKNVILDDWSVTGHQLANHIAHALQTVGGVEADDRFKNGLEVNLLVAREDQLADNFAVLSNVEENYRIASPLPVVSYFRAPAARQHEGPMPTGSHSSVDYGFESQIDWMRQYVIDKTGETMSLPYLASIVRTQRNW